MHLCKNLATVIQRCGSAFAKFLSRIFASSSMFVTHLSLTSNYLMLKIYSQIHTFPSTFLISNIICELYSTKKFTIFIANLLLYLSPDSSVYTTKVYMHIHNYLNHHSIVSSLSISISHSFVIFKNATKKGLISSQP